MRALLVLAAIAALAGCTTEPPGGDEYVVPDQDDQGRYVIRMTNSLKFEPANAMVPVNATVLWRHVGGAHNVAPEDDAWPASQVGQDFKLQVTRQHLGTHEYVCEPHESQGMRGSLRVVESVDE